MPLRSFAFVLLVLFLTVSKTVPAVAQQQTQPVNTVDTDKVDARAFAILFRRENEYLRIAKTAFSPDDPKKSLPKVIPSLFQLDSTDAGNFEQIAAQWELEVKPVRSQLNAAIAAFHNTFPNGRLTPGVTAKPPQEIIALRAQIDTITLQYRDRFRSVLQEQHFQAIQTKLRSNLGVTSQGIDATDAGKATGGVQ